MLRNLEKGGGGERGERERESQGEKEGGRKTERE